jgi:hypothetical protein
VSTKEYFPNIHEKYSRAPARIFSNYSPDIILLCGMTSAGIQATKEPVGLVKQGGKRHDGLTLVTT